MKFIARKSLLAIAAGMTLGLGAQAAEIYKTNDTSVELNADLYFYNLTVVEQNTAKTAYDKRNYVQGQGTQLQFKAKKTIDSDLTVFGQLEYDPDPVGDNATAVTDDMKFGITSKKFGTIQVGQFDSFMEDNVMEIVTSFVITGYSALVTEPAAGNDGRHVLYTNKIGDLAFGFDWTSSSTATGTNFKATDGSNGFAASAVYTLGDLKLVAGSSTIARYKADGTDNSSKAATGLGASYKMKSGFGSTTLAALTATNTSYSTTAANDGLDTKYNAISVHHVTGPWGLGAVFQNVTPTTASASTNGVTTTESGYQVTYDLGKGAKLYATQTNFGKNEGSGNLTEIGFLMTF
jgi:predicted porin